MNIQSNVGYTGILKFEFKRDTSYELEFHNNGKYPLFETIGKVLTGNISNDILIPTYLDIVVVDSNTDTSTRLLYSPTMITNGTLSKISETSQGIIITYLASINASNLITNNIPENLEEFDNNALQIRLLDRTTTKVMATVTLEGEEDSSLDVLISKLKSLGNGLSVAMEWSLIFDNGGNGGMDNVFTK